MLRILCFAKDDVGIRKKRNVATVSGCRCFDVWHLNLLSMSALAAKSCFGGDENSAITSRTWFTTDSHTRTIRYLLRRVGGIVAIACRKL